MRSFPAVVITWAHPPDDDRVDLLLATLDEVAPTGVEGEGCERRLFFPSFDVRDRALALIAALPAGPTAAALDVREEPWAERSQAALTPVVVGDLIISPPWHATAARRDAGPRTVIVIRPSTGFGTGHHATTRVCLALLQRYTPARRTVLDVGTGSGVLALAAWQLGADAVTAIDVDEDALAAARDNMALNQAPAVRVQAADLEAAGTTIGKPWQVLLANLTGALLIRAADALAALAPPDGWLIASGFEATEADGVLAAQQRAGWHLVDRLDEGSWVGVALHRRPLTSPMQTIAR